MSENPEAPPDEDATAPPADPAADAPSGPQGPFWVRGSDGSERGPFPTVQLAQASKDNVVKVHEADKLEFVIADANGEAIG